MSNVKQLIKISVLVFLTGCSQHIQTTSGRAYLEKYDAMNDYSPDRQNSAIQDSQDINQLIRQAAAVEPVLTFPARIGIARIDSGFLSTIPTDELEAWGKIRQNLGKDFGEFIPVNPMIANMVAKSFDYEGEYKQHQQMIDVVNKIRLGAARQHLDAVLIYEVYSREESDSNLLSIGNLTIIGAYVLPSKSVTSEGYANAMLIDVIQGYPYGTAEAYLDKSEMTTTIGQWKKMDQLSDQIKTEVANKLVVEVEDMFRDLQLELLRKRTRS